MKTIIIIFSFFLALSGCTKNTQELGSKGNPIKIYVIPGKESGGILKSAESMRLWLQNDTGLHFESGVPLSYIAVVEALGTKRADIAALSTSTYLLAREKYQAEPIFMTELNGRSTYRAQIITHIKSGLKKIEDITGKTVAYVDPSSASGHLLAVNLFKEKNILPKEVIFAGGHDSVVNMVYNRKVEAGSTFYSDPIDGVHQDARRLVKQQYPDVFEKVRILGFTTEIPNDALVLRKDFPLEIKQKVITSIDKWAKSAEGKATLKEMNNGSGLIPATDKDYDIARKVLQLK